MRKTKTLRIKSKRTAVSKTQPIPEPLRVLAVLEGTAPTNRILHYLRALSASGSLLDVVILNVQERRADGGLRGYKAFKQTEVDECVRTEVSSRIVSGAALWLEKVKINAVTAVEIGDPLTKVLQTARTQGAAMIVIGAPTPAGFFRWLASQAGFYFSGSLAARLVAASPLPVVVVK